MQYYLQKVGKIIQAIIQISPGIYCGQVFCTILQAILTNEVLVLPDELTNKPVETRLYVSTEDKGDHILTIKKANVVYL